MPVTQGTLHVDCTLQGVGGRLWATLRGSVLGQRRGWADAKAPSDKQGSHRAPITPKRSIVLAEEKTAHSILSRTVLSTYCASGMVSRAGTRELLSPCC